MDIPDSTDNPSLTPDTGDRLALQRKLQDAPEARPGTFRYSDSELGGEIRTSTDRPESAQTIATAEVFRPDGYREVVGTARYSVSGDEARIYPASLTAQNYGVESALLDEVSEQVRNQGAERLRVWVADDDPSAESRWLTHGFQPTERDPGAVGTQWEKRLAA